MAETTTKNVLVLLLLAALPLATLSSRAGPSSAHKSHGHGHKPSPTAQHAPPSPPSSPPSSPPAAPTPAASLVRTTCNSTAYYELCVSTLGADPSSATADVRGLSAIAVSVAAANASGGAATAAALAANGTAAASASIDDGTVQALLHACAAKYASARDALAAARDSIAVEDYDFASVHVSAAAEYPQVCRTLFQRQRPGDYPPELAAREVNVKQLCCVALDIIALLSDRS